MNVRLNSLVFTDDGVIIALIYKRVFFEVAKQFMLVYSDANIHIYTLLTYNFFLFVPLRLL